MPIRVLLVDAAGTHGLMYGGQRAMISIVERAGDEVVWSAAIPAAAGPYPERLRAAGVTVHQLPFRGPLPAARRALEAVLARHPVDLVHTHDLRASAIARPVAAARGLPLVATYQEALWHEHLRGPRRWRRALALRADRRTIHLPRAMIAVSQDMADELINLYGVDPRRVHMIPNAVDINALAEQAAPPAVAAAREVAGLAPGDLPVALVGSLAWRKGQHLLLAAAPGILARFPQAVFVLVGEGPQQQAYQAQAAELGVSERVRMVGFRDPAAPWFALAEVVVMPSLTEGMPIVALEAMALGKPLVASAVGGVPQLVAGAAVARVIPPDDAAALEREVIALLADPSARAALGEAAAQRVAERFDAQQIANQTLAVFHEVLAASR